MIRLLRESGSSQAADRQSNHMTTEDQTFVLVFAVGNAIYPVLVEVVGLAMFLALLEGARSQ